MRTSGAPAKNHAVGTSPNRTQASRVAPTGSVRITTATTDAATVDSRALKTV